jgi:hypothetical protein
MGEGRILDHARDGDDFYVLKRITEAFLPTVDLKSQARFWTRKAEGKALSIACHRPNVVFTRQILFHLLADHFGGDVVSWDVSEFVRKRSLAGGGEVQLGHWSLGKQIKACFMSFGSYASGVYLKANVSVSPVVKVAAEEPTLGALVSALINRHGSSPQASAVAPPGKPSAHTRHLKGID